MAANDSAEVWLSFHNKFIGVLENVFYKLGKWVATHTTLTLAMTLVFAATCCIGFVNFAIQTSSGEFKVRRGLGGGEANSGVEITRLSCF